MAGIGLPGRSSSFFFFWLRRVFILTGFSAIVTVSSESQISFRKPDFDTGKGPVAIAAADFNRDGLLDVVTANSLDNSITVLLNNGDGAFGRRVDYPTGKNPHAVVTADFNNDGIPDVAVANYGSNSISIFLGNGDGTLRLFASMAVGVRPDALTAGDFNHDGKIDLAVVNQGDNTLSIYFGTGDGRFRPGANYTASNCSSPDSQPSDSMVAADFNNDGVLDLAVANDDPVSGCSGVKIFIGRSDGTFNSVGSIAGVFGPLLTGDFNQDGNLDLVAQGVSECGDRGCFFQTLVFAGHGDGTFDQGHSMPCEVSAPIDGMRLAIDLNGDHVPDLAGDCVVLIDPATVFTGTATALPMPPTGWGLTVLAGGDFNADGRQDIVTANFTDSTISVLLGDGKGAFHQQLRYVPEFPDGINTIVSADLNGDGFSDVVVGGLLDPGALIYFGNGDGTLRIPTRISGDFHVLELAIGDLNGDRVPDLVMFGFADPNGPAIIRVLLGKGDGTFAAPIDLDSLAGRSMVLADFNGDGILDLAREVIGPSPSTPILISIQLGKGDGTFGPPITTPVDFGAEAIVAGDFNGDGILDLIAGPGALQEGHVAVFLGNGDGTFRNGPGYNVNPPIGSIAVADFNHDGKTDFVLPPYLFLGNGDGTFRQQGGVNGNFGKTRVADINGDGLPDLLIGGVQLAVLINKGDGTFQPPLYFSAGGAFDFTVADFDSDGHPDVAVNSADAAISMLLSRGAASAAGRDFQLALSAASITVRAGQSATSTVSITAMGSFNDPVTFSCTGLPAGATCSFSPATMTPPANGTRNVTLTITVSNAQTARLSPGPQGAIMFAVGLPMFGIIFAQLRGRRQWKRSAVLVLLMIAMVTLGGCAGIVPINNHRNTVGTPAGVFTITVIGTSGGSVVITRMQTMVLKVR